MLEDPKNAGKSLRSARTRYLAVCSIVRKYALTGDILTYWFSGLSNQIRNELNSFAGYKSRFLKAKTATTVVPNNIASVIPVNTLPTEILINIFHFVLALQPCTIDRLAQVCSRWRSIALGTCFLWTQIRYNPPRVSPEAGNPTALRSALLDHTKIHVFRSGHLPLHLYLAMEEKYEWYNGSIRSLLKCISSRIQSLHLNFPSWNYPIASNVQAELVSDLLLTCEPDIFTELTISSAISGSIKPQNHTQIDSILCLNLASKQLDKALSSIRVLHLNNLFPKWTSKAYHNLVDLRLVGSNNISESSLISILRKSPCLRIFHFGLSIGRQDKFQTDLPPPVELVELELLRVVRTTTPVLFCEGVEHLLSLISPGKKALRFFVENKTFGYGEEIDMPVSMKHTQAFIKRSNLAEIHAENYSLALEFLSWPITGHLSLYRCIIRDNTTLLVDDNIHHAPPSTLSLKTLYLCHCLISLDSLRLRLQHASIQRLVLYDNRYIVDAGTSVKEQVVTELSAVCQAVIIARDTPICVSNWLLGLAKEKFGVLTV